MQMVYENRLTGAGFLGAIEHCVGQEGVDSLSAPSWPCREDIISLVESDMDTSKFQICSKDGQVWMRSPLDVYLINFNGKFSFSIPSGPLVIRFNKD